MGEDAYARGVPDNEDYQWLAERLRNPGAWTENEYDTMRFLAGNQSESLRMMHPLDRSVGLG